MSNSQKAETPVERPDYEAVDGSGLTYVRKARVVGELPTPACRVNALEDASDTISKSLGLVLHKTVGFGTPVHLAFNMTRQQAKNHAHARLLLTKGDDIPLDHCPYYS